MQKNLLTIVALSIDSRNAILYQPDGTTFILPQGDARLPEIVRVSKAALERKLPVQVDITPIIAQRTEFAEAEKGTKGVVKFFKVAKSFLKKLVNTESPVAVPEEVAHVSPLTIGVFPGQGTKEENEAQAEVLPDPIKTSPIVLSEEESERFDAALNAPPAANESLKAAMGEFKKTNAQKLDDAQVRMHMLVGNSVGTDKAEFHTPLREDETIVAVHETTGAIIPDAQKLSRQLRASAKLQDYAGFEKFIERLASIIDDRGHSVEDLMKFIEKGDLPIADDGCIVIYKRLDRRGDYFVDVHSKNIKQKVGAYVFMRPGLVDPNRRQDCSNGLHVATLGYIGGFSGDVTIIAKVRPEDVFAVPEYSHTKMRVCGYHILVDLPEKLRNLVNKGQSISSDPDGARILNDVLRGHHIGIIQHVEVGGNNGTNVTYTDVDVSSADQLPVTAAQLGKAETLDMAEELQARAPVVADVLASDLVKPNGKKLINNIMSTPAKKAPSKAKKAAKKKAKPAAKKTVKAPAKEATPKKPSQVEQAAQLYAQMRDAMTFPEEVKAGQALLEFKKKARKSWTALGLPESTATEIPSGTGQAPAPEQKVDKPVKALDKVNSGDDATMEAVILLRLNTFTNVEIAEKTGLSKDQVYRLKKKHCS